MWNVTLNSAIQGWSEYSEQQCGLVSSSGVSGAWITRGIIQIYQNKKEEIKIFSISAVCCRRLCQQRLQQLTGSLQHAFRLKVNYLILPSGYLRIWRYVFQLFRPHTQKAIPVRSQWWQMCQLAIKSLLERKSDLWKPQWNMVFSVLWGSHLF